MWEYPWRLSEARPVWFEDVEKVQRMTAGGMAWRFVEHGDGQAVRRGRRAAMVVESWPLVAVLLAVKTVNESRASRCPSWWQPAGRDADERPPARRQDHEQGGWAFLLIPDAWGVLAAFSSRG